MPKGNCSSEPNRIGKKKKKREAIKQTMRIEIFIFLIGGAAGTIGFFFAESISSLIIVCIIISSVFLGAFLLINLWQYNNEKEERVSE